MAIENKFSTHEDLLNNTILEFGTNSNVLNHPDVVGIKVGKDTNTNTIWIEVFVIRITNSLSDLLHKEFKENNFRLTQASMESEINSFTL